jgi:hypothetical protein
MMYGKKGWKRFCKPYIWKRLRFVAGFLRKKAADRGIR